jgi:hypothetical protein
MTVRDELESAIELHGRIASNWEWEDTYNRACAELIRDHGQALLEALEDAERYRFIRSGVRRAGFDMGGNHHYSFSHDVMGVRGPSFDAAIDTARRGGG